MLMRFVRSATLQAAGQDFVRTAAAKGLTRTRALISHGIPAVGLSIITVLGLQIAGIIVGSVVIEQLFTLPGIGRMLVADVGTRDLVKVQSELRAHRIRAGRRVRRRSGASGDRPATEGGLMPGWLPRLLRTATGRFGLIVIALVALTALVSLLWTPFDPQTSDIGARWSVPSWPHLLGTDDTGRDILSLLMAGARTTVFVSVGAGIIATLVGIALAALGALTAGGSARRSRCSSTSSSRSPSC